MIRKTLITAAVAALAAVATGAAIAGDNKEHHVPRLDHVFVIVMENHGYQQVVADGADSVLWKIMPIINNGIATKQINVADNFYAVGHPSLTNYLEIVGGSNFGVRSDNAPDFHNGNCLPNIASGKVNADNSGGNAPSSVTVDGGSVCPIAGNGTDAATEAVDVWNEVDSTFPYLANIDGKRKVDAIHVQGKTIAEQLASAGKTWKTYQETLPFTGADNVVYSNGTSSIFADGTNSAPAPLVGGDIVKAYAAKHNPFVYFQSVQEGSAPGVGLANIVGFDGADGLYADLASGDVPTFSFIAPNQCNDQHGRGYPTAFGKFCGYDFGIDASGSSYGTTVGLNPGLMLQGDDTIHRIAHAIQSSKVWKEGRNAIVVIWDENDYSGYSGAKVSDPSTVTFAPQNTNHVLVAVRTSYRHTHGVHSPNYYNHFSLLKTLELGFGLPCLNHACDDDVHAMSDLFAPDGEE
jgi:hypothetical protein